LKEAIKNNSDAKNQKISQLEKKLAQNNAALSKDTSQQVAKFQKECADFVKQLEKQLEETSQSIQHETNQTHSQTYRQVVQLRTDFKLQVDKVKEELGYSGDQLPSKLNLYSLSRVIELILQYIMTHRLVDSKQDCVQDQFYHRGGDQAMNQPEEFEKITNQLIHSMYKANADLLHCK